MRACPALGRIWTRFRFYNQERLHQALDYQTPAAVYGAEPISA